MRRVMILSGAGLSAESGLSTFRGSDGLWAGHDVMEVCSVQGWEADPSRVTAFYDARRMELARAEPNAAHRMLADLEKRFPDRIVHLTQNVDDLLERAGCEAVIHLHGTLVDLRCGSCRHLWPVGHRAQGADARCPRCGSRAVRHNVVMFGEPAPNYRFIQPAIESCDLFVSIGTSGRVVDSVMIADAFTHSILVDPVRQIYVTSFGSHDRYIDEYFETFLQCTAVEAADTLRRRIEAFLTGR